MTAADLLSAITRCPVVDRCREGERLACSTIVASQTHHVAAFQVPEPWTSGEMLLRRTTVGPKRGGVASSSGATDVRTGWRQIDSQIVEQ